ncbi:MULTISPECIES: hypothetical protein [unclassified Natrinema]|uniref:Viral structural protein VP12 n=1 Tax=Saline Natrinema sp. J7-1 virus 2 TaxID=2847286 RepID=A0A976SFB0_9VIRU|nr:MULTISPECIES: hypothetical protein [unclassified Natrinema]YP_010772535.1 viral structural protein VP12 [Saline Natrinema sp. J7-1 virus 2]AFO55982.1 hypothetical protein NJ7G_0726 [Natrinema sp. J7-2]UUT36783.1 viral structural protein VP12 [Saline Natrinema sp. J7-1 virus 2]
MARDVIDKIDYAALWVYPTFVSMVFGVWSWNLEVLGGYNFSSAIYSAGGVDFSVPLIGATTSVLWILWTNEFDGSNYSDMEKLTIVGTLLLPIGFEFIPAVNELLSSNDWFLIGGTVLVTFATGWISYTE